MIFFPGKSTGIVTNTRLTHGTPSALYAHSASRYWEDDSKMEQSAKYLCKDITRQLVEDEPGKNINVSIISYNCLFILYIIYVHKSLKLKNYLWHHLKIYKNLVKFLNRKKIPHLLNTI